MPPRIRGSELLIPYQTGLPNRAAGQAFSNNIGQLKGMDHFTLHELRRTCATQLADLGVQPHVTEKILGHAMQGVMGIYNRHEYCDEQREALELWGDRLRQIKTQALGKASGH